MSAFPAKVLVCIPAYRKAEDVAVTLNELAREGEKIDTLLVEHGDRAVAEPSWQKRHPSLKLVALADGVGEGAAHLAGIEYAYEHGYDVVVTFVAGAHHAPSEIGALVRASEGADITIGSASATGGRSNVVQTILSNVESALGANVLGDRHDTGEPFRAYRLARIHREIWSRVHSRDRGFFVESLCVAHQNGVTIRDVVLGEERRPVVSGLGDAPRSIRQLVTLYAATKANPAQFRVATEAPEVDPALVDPQGWDTYWERKKKKSALTYEVVAAIYRNLVLRDRLTSWIRATFPSNAKLLHAGCGSGQVDVELHDYARITAVDISIPALELYKLENPKVSAVKHASVLSLPFADGSFDGAYNLGVVEHFEKPELSQLFRELHRVIKPGGKIVVFWPHARATSVAVLGSIHWVLNDVLKKDIRLHPAEVSLVHSRQEAEALFATGGFDLESYDFGPRDFFVQVVAVGRRRASVAAAPERKNVTSAVSAT